MGTAQDGAISEYQVKAAYLYNFAKFVEWPAKSFTSASAPYRICILGKDPFREALQDLVRGKLVNGREFQIIGNVTAPPQTTSCHILFVSASAGAAGEKHSDRGRKRRLRSTRRNDQLCSRKRPSAV